MLLFSIYDLGREFRLDESTVLHMLRQGDVPRPIRVGGPIWRWPRPMIDTWLADGCPKCQSMTVAELTSKEQNIIAEIIDEPIPPTFQEQQATDDRRFLLSLAKKGLYK